MSSKTERYKGSERPKQYEVILDTPIESGHDFTLESLAQVAWAIFLTEEYESNEVFFGTNFDSNRSKLRHFTGLEERHATLMPCKFEVPPQATVRELLEGFQRLKDLLVANKSPGLHWLRQVNPAVDRFTTAITCQDDSLCDIGSMETVVRLESCPGNQVLHLTSYKNTPLQRIARRFVHILRQLCRKDSLDIAWSTFVGICEEDIEEIHSWNSIAYPTSTQTVHGLFDIQLRKRPEVMAVCAWDGSLTYSQLDKYSTLLAFHLLDQGIQPGSIVALCFEKSMLMPISMLAVAKAGITGLGIDPDQPEGRLAQVVTESKAAALLCSLRHHELSSRLGAKKALPLGLDDLSLMQLDDTRSLPTVKSSDILYAVFTSGSTGKPKGVLVSHGSYSAAAICQHEPFGFSQEARVLDFSSYAFDAAWFNLMHTITSGGCLCVPSTDDLRNHLGGCILQFGVTFAFLTPTVCRGIERKALIHLKRLLLGGEMIVPSDIALFADNCIITLVYGPSECTPMTMFHNPENSVDIALGHGMGTKTWVVNPDNVHQLCPIGTIGELCLEGPLLGAGYLEDKLKTEQAFIRDLSWHRDPQAQIYRTGDLVKYIGDDLGTLVYVRRKDTQVKLRGQRVELGEIEQHVHQAIMFGTPDHLEQPNLNIVAEVVHAEETENAVLVTFVSLRTNANQSEADHQKTIRQLTVGISDRLEQVLPSYMVPTSYIPLSSIPTTITGKTDRVRLQAMGARCWRKFTVQDNHDEIESTVSKNPTERMLQKVWSEVLNLPLRKVSTTKRFTSLGGDSITAMQVVSQCRKQGVALTVADILSARTILRLSLRCCVLPSSQQSSLQDDSEVVAEDEKDGEPFGLSPIQQRYFQMFPDGENHFNQCFMLELVTDVSQHDLQKALRAIIDRHSMLRARYHRSSQGLWSQHIAPLGPWNMIEHAVSKPSEAFNMAKELQKQLNIVNGPVFLAVHFTVTNHRPLLLLSAHHLVIDLVSWRVIWRDLEDFIRNKCLLSARGISFRRWCKEQHRESCNLMPDTVLPFAVPPYDTSFWGCASKDQVRGNAIDSTMILDRDSSQLLMGHSNDTMRTEPLDIILGALAHSFGQSFPEHKMPTVFLEGHGREPLGIRRIDCRDTVGWFTVIYPLPLPTKPNDNVVDAVCLAKDTRRRVPSKGQEYFASRFYSETCRDAFKEHDAIEILVNFAGSYQQLENDGGLFKLVPPPSNEEGMGTVAKGSPRLALIELEMLVRNGKLELTMSLNKHMLHRDRLSIWQGRFLKTIRDAATALNCVPARITRADVPLLSLSDAALRYFNDIQLPAMAISPKDIIDAYPASPLQEGISLSAYQGLSTYDTFWIWKCLPRNGEEKVDMAQLAEAWRSVVRKHSILCTVMVPDPSGEGLIQLVLSEPEIKVICLEIHGQDPEDVLYQLQRPLWTSQGSPRHCFTVYQSGVKTAFRLDINHALIDGGSLMPLIQDLRMAYNGFHSIAAPPFGEMIRYLSQSNHQEKIDWWGNYLHKTKPCEVLSIFNQPIKGISHDNERFRYVKIPQSATVGVIGFCQRFGITRSVFLQVVWAMVLSYLTDAPDVCFGYLTSGRDAPIQDVDRMIGPLANMLISKIQLNQSASAVLRQTSDDSIQHLLHQHVSLAQVQHAMGLSAGRRLFNTAMTLRESDRFDEDDANGKISFEYHDHQDPHEFDLLLSARVNSNDLDVSVQLPQDLLDNETTDKLTFALTSAIDVLISSEVSYRQHAHIKENEETLFTNFKRIMTISAQKRDLDLIWSWNCPLPDSIQRCAHDEIYAVALQNWNQPAVCAWDGEISYGELEQMSTRVANNLREQGIGRGHIVPICFEKSMWMPVAALGVMKAGAAVVALDITLPVQRLQVITKQVQSDIILASLAQTDLAGRLGFAKLLVLPNHDEQPKEPAQIDGAVASSPDDLLYIVFTSGSTGTPKGTMLTHSHVCSMLHHQREIIGLTSGRRVYNFASYAFDVAWDDFFHALTSGGCLCIPSEEDRKNNIETSMAMLRANYVHITPTILRHIDWSKATGISVVNLSGEPVAPSDRSILSRKTKVVNLYGPAETNVVTVQDLDELTTQEVSIGKGYGASTWIVDLKNSDILAPIGEIGELWIEGPLSGLGYLAETTEFQKASWVKNPIWLTRGTERFPGRHGQLYRTGDLVRYTKDGSLIYCGRADRQVKINGQRVELGEIDVALQALVKRLGHDWHVAVETVQSLESDVQVIMAFVAPRNVCIDEKQLENHIMQEASLLREQLRSVLPQYMVPRAFVPLAALPLTATGKVNLRKLQAHGSSKSIREWVSGEKSSIEICPADTESEKAMVRVCRDVLQMSKTTSISMNDNFFRIGGDSVLAMRLVSKARDIGYSLIVRDIFKHPVIRDLAKVAKPQKSTTTHELEVAPPVADKLLDDAEMRGHAAYTCNVTDDQIVDMLPCTPLQRNLASWARLHPKGHFRTTHQLELKQHTDIPKFKQCWDMVVERNPITRTHIVNLPKLGYTQVIVDRPSKWIDGSTLEQCHKELASRHTLQGEPLVNFALARLASPTNQQSAWFLCDLHWAAYDGWSLRLLLSEAQNLYHGRHPHPLNDMRVLTNSLWSCELAKAESYWQNQFSGLTHAALAFPQQQQQQPLVCREDSTLLRPGDDHDASVVLQDFGCQGTGSGFTASTLIRAALGIVLARHLQTDRVVFGATVTGRQGAATGLDRMAGPAFVTLPICMSVDRGDPDVLGLLEKVQAQTMDMIPFEQTDLERWRYRIPGADIACDFRVLLVVQSHIAQNDVRNHDPDLESVFTEGLKAGKDALVELGWRSGRRLPMFVECQIQENGRLALRLRIDSRTADEHVFISLLQELKQEMLNLNNIATGAL
uniref:Nonribosomal peptide synthetase 8 n=1 Tax=Cochliobolus heterostrophus TaxID=5016 RepID=Q5D6D1_COCHE|nr:nonribosomal peptide synthetase 8 [Bipolaris maydis]